MKQRLKRKYVQKKQHTNYMDFLIKTGKHRHDNPFYQPPLVPFIRSFRLGLFPDLMEIKLKKYGFDNFLN
jgi:hypothetical protein